MFEAVGQADAVEKEFGAVDVFGFGGSAGDGGDEGRFRARSTGAGGDGPGK